MRAPVFILLVICAQSVAAQVSLKLTGINADGERQTIGYLLNAVEQRDSSVPFSYESYMTPDGYVMYLRKKSLGLVSPGVAHGVDSPDFYYFQDENCGIGVTDPRPHVTDLSDRYFGAIWGVQGPFGQTENVEYVDGFALPWSRRAKGISSSNSFFSKIDFPLEPGEICDPDFDSPPRSVWVLKAIDLQDYGLQRDGGAFGWVVVDPEWEVESINRPLFCSDFESCPAE